jgi:hypothetical protein
MNRTNGKNSLAVYSWEILIGMAGLPILGILAKAFSSLDALWGVMAVGFVLLALRGFVGFLFPKSKKDTKGADPAALHSH